jgi:hypothetical protein
MTSAVGACKGLQALYVEYEEQREANEGKVPLCKFTGSEKAEIGKGHTSIPQLTISKWIERPDALQSVAAAAPAEAVVEEEDDDAEF